MRCVTLRVSFLGHDYNALTSICAFNSITENTCVRNLYYGRRWETLMLGNRRSYRLYWIHEQSAKMSPKFQIFCFWKKPIFPRFFSQKKSIFSPKPAKELDFAGAQEIMFMHAILNKKRFVIWTYAEYLHRWYASEQSWYFIQSLIYLVLLPSPTNVIYKYEN